MENGQLRFRDRTVERIGPGWSTTEVVIQDAWYEVSIDDDWTASFRLTIQQGRPMIGELRIFPTGDRNLPGMSNQPGEWDIEAMGYDADVPPGGVTATLVRKVPFKSLSAIPDIMKWIRTKFTDTYETISSGGFPVEGQRRRPGPPGKSDEYLVEYVQKYLDLVAAGKSNPHTILSRHRQSNADHSRYLVTKAKQRGLYAPAGGGQAGGSLTPRGSALLKKIKRSKGKAR